MNANFPCEIYASMAREAKSTFERSPKDVHGYLVDFVMVIADNQSEDYAYVSVSTLVYVSFK